MNRERFNSEGYWNHSKKSSALFDVPGADRPELDGCFVGGIFDFGEIVTIPENLPGELREEFGEAEMDNIAPI